MAMVASSGKLSGAEFFVKGWKGDEAEEVDICSSEDEGSFGFENEEGVGEVGGEVGFPQQLGKRKRALSPSGSSISRDTGPCSPKRLSARAYRRAFYMDDSNPGPGKGKEQATDEGMSNRRNQQRDLKRKKQAAEELSPGPSFRDLSPENLCTWNTQWVCCCRCKKWRRIPYDVDVEIATWECKDNGWSAIHASCDYPQDVVLRRLNETIDHTCALSVDLSAAATHVTGSSLDEQLDSDDSYKRVASKTGGKPSDSETAAMEIEKPEADLSGQTSKVPEEHRCQKCGLEGQTISCSLCQSGYHVNCLDPPLIDSVAQGWHCESCSNRTGVESVYMCTNNESYYVKWKGRSHVHNSILTEAELAKLAPKKLAYLKKRHRAGKALKWDPIWAEPQRFIAKRESESRQTEWYVKWRGLGYEQCTWEPADSGVCASENGLLLALRYEQWCEAASSPPAQAVEICGKLDKLSRRPDWMKNEKMEQHQLEMLNKLRECWFNRKEGIVLGKLNQEHMIPLLAFIVWVCRVSCQPILMVMPFEMLHLWDKKLGELQPELNSVVFHGCPEARQLIQQYEFDLIKGRSKCNIVISTFESVLSASDSLNSFAWSALLVDESHVKAGKSFFRSIGLLRTDFRLIFSTLSEPCKNNVQELLQMLALFDKGGCEDDGMQLADVIEKLREHVVCDHKVKSSNFREFWIPAQMPPVQIHRYCETLVEHYELLRSGNMSQGDAHLQNVMQLLQSCCCHPYIGTQKMSKSVEEVALPEDYLRLGIKASGKLDLLHRLLLQYHTDKKTVLILVQPNSMELKNILDDYLRQQFGCGSYVRIERKMDAKRRQSALGELNDKDSGCFALLLDRNAPVQYQLRDMDAVFVYESDWNPWSDTSYIQSLGIGNKYRIYRLYICHSIEEKILLYARQGLNLSTLRNVNARRFQEILQWGAKLLFELDEWNLKSGASTDARIGWEGVIEDMAISLRKHLIFLNDAEVKQLATTDSEPTVCSEKLKNILSPREPSEEGIPLYGVPTNVVLDGSSSAESFWSLLLKDKHAELMQLNEPKKLRKREHATENESRKKAKLQQQKVARGDTVVHNSSPGVCSAEVPEENSPNNVAEEPIQEGGLEEAISVQSQDLEPASSAKSMREEQQELVDTAKPELKFICESLKMPANVLGRAEELLDFAANNLRMSRDYLRELELSLCWIAAEQLDVNFDLSGAVSVVSTTYNTTVDEGAVAAVCLKLKDQFSVSLPQLFKGAARSSEEVPRSPERVTSDSSQEVLPGRVQTEIDAAVLERTKTDLLRRRSHRRMKLLDYQKVEWCRLMASKETETEKAKQLCNMECRIIELSDETQYQKFQKIAGRKLKQEARLKAIEDRHSRERQTLLLRQRSCRELESCVIASHLDQLQNGFLPGPLPELILPEVADRVTEDLVSRSEQGRLPSSQIQEEERISPRRKVTHMGTEQQSQADLGEKRSSSKSQQEQRQVKLLDVLTPCGKSREGQVSHPEQEQMNGQVPHDGDGVQESVEETDEEAAARREHNEERPTRQEVDSERSEPQTGVNERRPMADQQQPAGTSNQPQTTASAVSMPQLQLNGPQRQDIQNQVRQPTAAQSTQTRSLSVAVSGAQSQTQVYAPAIVSTEARSQTDRSQFLQPPASQQTQTRLQIQTDRPVSSTQVGRQLAPQRQTSRSQTQTQNSAAGIQRQVQPASTQAQSMGQTQAQHLVGSQVPPLLRAQSQMLPVAQSQVAAGPIRQANVQDPLSNEEAKLIKERERTKKLYNEEVARIQLQYQQAMETLHRNYRQRDESFGTNLQKASEQRRLADALRKRDRLGTVSPRRQAGSSADYIPQLNPLTAFQNSMPAFQAPASFQGSNQLPVQLPTNISPGSQHVQLPTNVSPGSQPVQLPTNISPGSQPVLPFLVTGTRPVSPCFLPVHQGRVEHTRPDSGGQSRLERDQVATPATARSEQQQSFATQRHFGATGARNDSATAHFRQQQQQQQQLRMNQGSPGTEQLNFQLRLQQQQHQPPRTEHVSPHLRSTTVVDAVGNEQVSSLSRLNHHFRASPTGTLEQATAQFRLQHMTEQGGQHFRQATGSDCTGTEQFRLQQQASQQLRAAEQHVRVSEGRGTEQASSQLGIQQQQQQQQVRVSRTGEWPQLYQTRVGGEQQLPSPQLHQMLQQHLRAPPPWNPPPSVLRTAPVNTPITNSVNHNIIIQNNNIVSSNVNSGPVTQAQANELRASSQNMYTSIGRQLQLGTAASMLGLDPRFFPVRPVQQQQQQQQQQLQQHQLLQHQRLPHQQQQQHVQLPLDGPAVMSERDYIYLSDDE